MVRGGVFIVLLDPPAKIQLKQVLPQPFIDLSIFGSRRPMVFDYIVLDSIHAIAVEQESPKFASHTSTHQPQKRSMNILPPVPCPHVDRFLIPHSLKIAQLYHRINFYGIELPPARFVFFQFVPFDRVFEHDFDAVARRR